MISKDKGFCGDYFGDPMEGSVQPDRFMRDVDENHDPFEIDFGDAVVMLPRELAAEREALDVARHQAYEICLSYLNASGGSGFTAQCESLICEDFEDGDGTTSGIYSYCLALKNSAGDRVIIEEGRLVFYIDSDGYFFKKTNVHHRGYPLKFKAGTVQWPDGTLDPKPTPEGVQYEYTDGPKNVDGQPYLFGDADEGGCLRTALSVKGGIVTVVPDLF